MTSIHERTAESLDRIPPDRMSSAQNTARVLMAFSDRPGTRGVSELSRKLGLGKSTVHRILSALVAERLLEHDPVNREYRLSLASIDLASAATAPLQLHDAVIPHLVRLHQRTGQSVHLGVLDGTEVVFLERLVSRGGRYSAVAQDTRLPMHYSSCGKAIAAYLPDDDLKTLLAAHRFDAATAQTIVDPAHFRRELRLVRARGWARTVNEHRPGLASIGAAIQGNCGQVVAAIGIVRKLDAGREEELRHYAQPLIMTATAISRNIKAALHGR